MREVPFSYIESLWKKCVTPVGVYVHSPFCEQECTYCVYKGKSGCSATEVEDYYVRVLPERIEQYRNILNELDVDVVYFGGGTPNHMGSLTHLEKAVDLLTPELQRAKEVIIELHMGYRVTPEQLDWLKQKGFTTVILCVQTFNLQTLRNRNRVVHFNSEEDYIENIESTVEYCYSIGLKTGFDLMYYPRDPIAELNLENDLTTISSFRVLPDEITIGPEYRYRSREVLETVYHSASSCLGGMYSPEFYSIDTFEHTKCLRLYCNGRNLAGLYTFTPYLDDNVGGATEVSTLGIGAYKNSCKDTFSVVNSTYSYCERLDDLASQPSFYMMRQLSFWDKCRNMIDWLEQNTVGDPPYGFNLCFVNNPEENTFYKNVEDGTINFTVGAVYPTEYMERLIKKIEAVNAASGTLEEIQLKTRSC